MAVQNKKVKYYGDSLKNPILGEFTEKKYIRGLPKKRGLVSIEIFREDIV